MLPPWAHVYQRLVLDNSRLAAHLPVRRLAVLRVCPYNPDVDAHSLEVRQSASTKLKGRDYF